MRTAIAAVTLFLAGVLTAAAQTAPPPVRPLGAVRFDRSSATSPAGTRAFQPSDWYRLASVAAPAMSPDGKLVAFTVTTVAENDNRRHSEVWVVPTAGGEPTRYTSPSTESTRPRFSRDGKLLYFTSQRPGGRGTTWALRMDRPGGEAFQPDSAEREDEEGSRPRDRRFVVTTTGGDAGGGRGGRGGSTPPDSTRDSVRADDPFARMQPMARPPHGAITKPLDTRRFDGRHIVDLGFKSNNAGYVPNRRAAPDTPRPSLIVIGHADGRRDTLTRTRYSHRSPVVSPDGRWIAFLADARLRPDSLIEAERDSLSRLPYDRAREQREMERNDTDIFVIPTAGGTPRRLELPGTESGVAWSPDGKLLSFISRPSRVTSSRLYVVDPNGGRPRNLLGDWKYEPGSVEWTPQGEILMSADIGGRSALFRLSPSREGMREVLGGRRRISAFAYDSAVRRVAYVSTSIDTPPELYIADTDGRNERKLTAFNAKLNSEVAFSDAERFTYKSVGDLEIEGWLMKPYGHEPGRKYPLVLYIHGGPHSAYGEGWFDEFQNIASAGMWVLFTNPRGSSGYGQEFAYTTRGRWGAEDYEDLMRAVDIAARRPDVDSTRMGVTGGSYGGFMTAWITTKTDRFKAAQTDRMISNWASWYGSSDAQGLTEFEFFGRPWENWAVYDSLSPIKHVAKVKTPTLIVQSEEDFRTPMTDAEQWFVALRKLNVPVEFVRYPRSTHELSRSGEPWLLVDRLSRLRQWFTHWLIDVPAGGARAAAPAGD
jgi:dipeptidyl aminopeptidase/acylaminoacyl peptidase